MSQGQVGSDPEELRRVAAQLADAAARLDEIRLGMGSQLQSAPWIGPAADGFRSDWSRVHQALLAAAAAHLRLGQDGLVRNAEEQLAASSSDGGVWAAASALVLVASAVSFDSGGGSKPPAGGNPGRVADWWNALSEPERNSILARRPDLIRNLDGIPAAVRDKANRAVLVREKAVLAGEVSRLRSRLATDPSHGLLNNDDRKAEVAEAKLRALEEIENAVGAPGSGRQLLMFDTSGKHVLAAVAVGDVDSARNVAVFTPGLDTTVEGDLSAKVADMGRLVAAADGIPGSHGGTAAVAWLGYEAPQTYEMFDDSRSVINWHAAEAGGHNLHSFLEGIRATHHGDLNLTAVGHSYGSTTTGYALQQGGSGVHNAVFLGSPGLGTTDLGNLAVPERHAFVMEAAFDPVADLGRFGTDPNQLDGIRHLDSDPPRSLDDAGRAHSGYFEEGSMNLRNIACVVVDMPDLARVPDNGTGWGTGDVIREIPNAADEVARRYREAGGNLAR